MAENIKEVIARLKNNQQNSQASKPIPTPAKVVVPQETKEVEEEILDDALEDAQEEEEMPKIEADPVEKTDPQSIEQEIAMEIELLQNDGRFRVELLHQMQEMNKALVVIAGVLVDLKNGKA